MTGAAPQHNYYQLIVDDVYSKAKFDARSFNVHKRESIDSNEIVIFIHGFMGNGYGAWADFPQLMFYSNEGPPIDIGIFRYRTGIRAAATRSVNLDMAAERLSEALKELSITYKSIHFVVHSLGGIMADSAVKTFLDDCAHSNRQETSIGAMFFFASPRAGTSLAVPFLKQIVKEFQWLASFSPQTATLDKFFTANVQSEPIASVGGKRYLIPRYACVAEADGVVSLFSVIFGVPRARVYFLDKNHKHLVKPVPDDCPQVGWVCRELAAVRILRRQWMRELAHSKLCGDDPLAPTLLVTELWTGTAGTKWVEKYFRLRTDMSDHRVLVKDIAEVKSLDVPVNLLISVHDAARVLDVESGERQVLKEARERHAVDEQLTVGIAPVGECAATAREKMESWLLPDRPHKDFFIESAHDDNKLESLMRRWMGLASRPSSAPRRRESVPRFADRIIRMDDPIDFGRSRRDET